MDRGSGTRRFTYRTLLLARKSVVFVLGMVIVLIGVALLVLPGPGLLTIGLGLLLLATEFPWAKRLAHRLIGPAWAHAKEWWAKGWWAKRRRRRERVR